MKVLPDDKGHFGIYGGRYVSETLMPAILELEKAYNNRGRAYAGLNQHRKAIEDYSKAIQLDPKSAIIYNNRGAAYYELGEYHKAIEDYDKALELDPEHTLAKYNKEIAEKALKKKK